jgi:hypothetical protein
MRWCPPCWREEGEGNEKIIEIIFLFAMNSFPGDRAIFFIESEVSNEKLPSTSDG